MTKHDQLNKLALQYTAEAAGLYVSEQAIINRIRAELKCLKAKILKNQKIMLDFIKFENKVEAHIEQGFARSYAGTMMIDSFQQSLWFLHKLAQDNHITGPDDEYTNFQD